VPTPVHRSRVFGFPNPVNEVSARLVATGVVVMAVALLATQWWWLLVPLTYGFLARVLTGPKLSPLGRLVTQVVTPRLRVEARMVPGPPKRFAQGMGLAFTASASILALLGFHAAALVLIGMLTIAASLEAFAGLCLGCKVFAVLMRAGVIPETVCEECNDIWSRAAA
jgi:hypothetical protein